MDGKFGSTVAGFYRMRCMLVLASAVLLSLAAAVPAFAVEKPPEDGAEQGQITGGEPVSNGKYKFMAAVRDVTRGSGAFSQQFCGGTLIDGDSVLTAAHCLGNVERSELRVTVGITDLGESQGQTRGVARLSVHPRYDPSVSNAYDAAVLQLGRPVGGIAPVRIPATTSNGFETPGREATIAGWGDITQEPPEGDDESDYPERMHEARVPVVSDATADEAYERYSSPLMLAAGREGKDTCRGDSGGPIFVQSAGTTYQIGIASFGIGCGADGFPGVYAEANASPIRSFIVDAAGL